MLEIENFIIIYLIATLAVYRLAFLFVFEEGLFGIGNIVRKLLGAYTHKVTRINPLGQSIEVNEMTADNWFGKAITCFNCTSVWFAFCAALVIVWTMPSAFWYENVSWFVAHSFAISGGAMVWKGITV